MEVMVNGTWVGLVDFYDGKEVFVGCQHLVFVVKKTRQVDTSEKNKDAYDIRNT